jgi:hypothetical protein
MIQDKLREGRSGILLYGITAPKADYTAEKLAELSRKRFERIKDLPIDALILYDVQNEGARTSEELPFPYAATLDPYRWTEELLPGLPFPRIVYRPVGKYSPEEFSAWLGEIRERDCLSVFVGAPAPDYPMRTPLAEAYRIRREVAPDLALGGIFIPERHRELGGEPKRVLGKVESGCSFFVSQGVFDAAVAKDYLSDYYYESLELGRKLVTHIFTLAPCGSLETLKFLKWLGISVPRWIENELAHSRDALEASLRLALDTARDLAAFCDAKGIPWGFNVESVSIKKTEIEASTQLLRQVKAMIDARG